MLPTKLTEANKCCFLLFDYLVLNGKKKLRISVETQIFECTVKLKCVPKAVTNIQLAVSQANTALPGPATSKILSFRIDF